MENRNIIVIGASAGGISALKQLCSSLPADLNASVFIVWHMAPAVRGVLPQILNQVSAIHAAHGVDGEPIVSNRMYIAPPDHHMLIEQGRIRISHGPKENRFRPAVDPLFRSAAYTYGNRVIGVVLSGALDDGTAGLWTIKYRGGLTIVQDPIDAEVSSMPDSAIRQVTIDHIIPAEQMGPLLAKLVQDPANKDTPIAMEEDEKTKAELEIAGADTASGTSIFQFGVPSTYACPECHGVLTMLKDGNITRFRCHTGHAFSADALLEALTESIEDSLYNAIRGVDESVILLNHLGDHFAEANQPRAAAVYFQRATKVSEQAAMVRKAIRLAGLSADDEEPDAPENPKMPV
ncbi:chemotaxis protein CheB [Dyadobacter sandarakinus]|uniref:protein-glutamate methylesterase n=1 Tax=Dyadobacter sandarakinus TaxID=2747268 RepID=A0ABX7I3L5_9BACT|nr:chemotaxis protein CheB [Dyadobacter sandarakinus]QRR00661.1 chemotaxis protein CheB [Dyadobacter sandarakinus]